VLSPYSSIEEDLSSRDLTINAVARDDKGRLFAHPLALHDLEKGLLRPISRKNFERDPLRVYRAARFAALFPGFSISPTLIEVIAEVGSCGSLMKTIPRERVAREFLKALSSPSPSRFFDLLINNRATAFFMEEIEGKIEGDALSLIDALAGDEMGVWLAFCCYFLCSYQRSFTCVEERLLSLVKGIGLPRRFVRATRVFLRYYLWGKGFSCLPARERVELLLSLSSLHLEVPFFRVMEHLTGEEMLLRAEREIEIIRSVHLPPCFRDLGPGAGKVLREMQADALERLS